MSAFKFRLDSVVSLKKKVEDERKTALARAKKDLNQRETDLVNLCKRRKACQGLAVADQEGGNLDISRKLIYYAYMEKITEEITSHTCAVERSKENVEAKRDLLLESSREKKALEKLRERMKARYMSKAKKAEQADLDEIAGKIHCRKGDGNLQWKKE
jgi:flagellar export protein FliJ